MIVEEVPVILVLDCRLVGRPVSRSGRNVAKKMVCLVYSEAGSPSSRDRPLRVKVVFLNAIQDHVEVRTVCCFTFLVDSNCTSSFSLSI